MYEAYIFDLYGTLVDIRTDEEMPYLWKKMSEIYTSMGAFYEPEELHDEMRRLEEAQVKVLKQKLAKCVKKEDQAEILAEPDLTEVFAKLYEQKGCAVTEETARLTAITFRAISRLRLEVYAGVKETLARLRSEGKKLYLLSNAQRDFTCPELEMTGLTGCFDGILISSVEGVKKPSRLFFDRLLERYGLDAKKCLMVGNDEQSDIGGAIRVGMDSLYIHTDISPEIKADSKATYCVMSGGFEQAAKRYLLEPMGKKKR